MRDLVKIEFGSHLYGTNTPNSDKDFKAVHVPNVRDIVLGKAPRSIQIKSKHGREQAVNGKIGKNLPTDTDFESSTLKFFLDKLVVGDPMALDMYFAPPKNIIHSSAEWRILRAYPQHLINKNITVALDYCKDQVKKYGTKGSRVAELRLVKEFLETKSPDAALKDFTEEVIALTEGLKYTRILVVDQNGTDFVFLSCCGKSLDFNAKIKQILPPVRHMFDKFGQRSLLAEQNEGIDWKAVSHALRVQYEVIELLNTGKITFPLAMCNDLIEIKLGKRSFKLAEKLMEEADESIARSLERSTLPEASNTQWVESFVYEVYSREVIRNTGIYGIL